MTEEQGEVTVGLLGLTNRVNQAQLPLTIRRLNLGRTEGPNLLQVRTCLMKATDTNISIDHLN